MEKRRKCPASGLFKTALLGIVKDYVLISEVLIEHGSPGVQSSAGVIRNNYLSKEESFMYDREGRFRMEDTMNAARIEYTEKAVMHMAARRCDVIRISQTEAVLALLTKYNMPNQFLSGYSGCPHQQDRLRAVARQRQQHHPCPLPAHGDAKGNEPYFRVQHASGT